MVFSVIASPVAKQPFKVHPKINVHSLTLLHVEQCQVVNRMLQEAKVSYYSSLILENS